MSYKNICFLLSSWLNLKKNRKLHRSTYQLPLFPGLSLIDISLYLTFLRAWGLKNSPSKSFGCGLNHNLRGILFDEKRFKYVDKRWYDFCKGCEKLSLVGWSLLSLNVFFPPIYAGFEKFLSSVKIFFLTNFEWS